MTSDNLRAAWGRLVQKVRRRAPRPEEAEDLLHSAFIRLQQYRARGEIRNPEALLVQAAVRIGIDGFRRERLARADGDFEDLTKFADPAPLQDEVYAARERLERVGRGLARLTPRTRDVFLMHRLEGLKYREIAARLGVSQSAVEKHIAKAALFLAEWMDGDDSV